MHLCRQPGTGPNNRCSMKAKTAKPNRAKKRSKAKSLLDWTNAVVTRSNRYPTKLEEFAERLQYMREHFLRRANVGDDSDYTDTMAELDRKASRLGIAVEAKPDWSGPGKKYPAGEYEDFASVGLPYLICWLDAAIHSIANERSANQAKTASPRRRRGRKPQHSNDNDKR